MDEERWKSLCELEDFSFTIVYVTPTCAGNLVCTVLAFANHILQIQPDDVEVVNVTTSVRNGEVWIIRDVLK